MNRVSFSGFSSSVDVLVAINKLLAKNQLLSTVQLLGHCVQCYTGFNLADNFEVFMMNFELVLVLHSLCELNQFHWQQDSPKAVLIDLPF